MLNYDALRSLKAEAYPKLCARLDTVPTVFRDGDGNYKLRGDYFEKQTRIVLKNCEVIDPENIEEYIALGGYQALADLLERKATGKEIVDEMTRSGLRGRGGAGFPTGRKWAEALKHDADHKYVICNADEGDPGAYMDRSVLENECKKNNKRTYSCCIGLWYAVDRKSVV